MPYFCEKCGADEYICQCCASIKCSKEESPEWRKDLTRSGHAGCVCPTCVRLFTEKRKREVMAAFPGVAT